MNRRTFFNKTLKASLGLGAASHFIGPFSNSLFAQEKMIYTKRMYLEEILYTRQEVDMWMSGNAFPFSKYHPEFGWLLGNAHFKDGVDDSISSYTYVAEDGERIMSNYKEKPCRINTYGNSFTQCHQVSDHETWQEVLAAHLQEPVRNFGIGGWSVYQAYLRMLFEETRKPAEYIIFNIYLDDHKRNLDSWRNIRVRKHPQHIEAPLPFVKVNLEENKIFEYKNPCPTVESLYDLCDIDKTYEIFKDDFVLKIMVMHKNSETKNSDQNYAYLNELVKTHGINTNLDKYETTSAKAEALHQKAALFSSMKIVEKVEEFAKKNNKKVLYVLSGPGKSVAEYISEGKRVDIEFVEFLNAKNLPCIDLFEKHKEDFLEHRLDIKDYIKKYFIGHYTPLGNFFCAYALKDKLVELLNPKPFPYR